MFHSILAHIWANWKIEAAVAAVSSAFIFLGLLLHDITGPKILFGMSVLADWENMISQRMVVSTLISAGTGYFVWWLQKRSTAKRVAIAEGKAADLEKIVSYEREEKSRIAKATEALLTRVGETEKALSEFKEKIALMDQTVKPLFEAAKIKLIEVLTHPSPEFKIPDDLLAKVKDPNGNISTQEMTKLEGLLKQRETSTHPEVTAEEKLAAAILPTVIKFVALEASVVDRSPPTVQMVSSPGEPVAKKEKEEEKA